MDEWYYQFMGDTFGPLSAKELKSHAARGRLPREAIVRQGKDGKWVSAERVHGLEFALRVDSQRQPLKPKSTDASVPCPDDKHSQWPVIIVGVVATSVVLIALSVGITLTLSNEPPTSEIAGDHLGAPTLADAHTNKDETGFTTKNRPDTDASKIATRLTEQQRRKLFLDLNKADNQIWKRVDAHVNNVELARTNPDEWRRVHGELSQICDQEQDELEKLFATKYSISQDDVLAVIEEGVKNRWPSGYEARGRRSATSEPPPGELPGYSYREWASAGGVARFLGINSEKKLVLEIRDSHQVIAVPPDEADLENLATIIVPYQLYVNIIGGKKRDWDAATFDERLSACRVAATLFTPDEEMVNREARARTIMESIETSGAAFGWSDEDDVSTLVAIFIALHCRLNDYTPRLSVANVQP